MRRRSFWLAVLVAVCSMLMQAESQAQCPTGDCGPGNRAGAVVQRVVTAPRQVVENVRGVLQESDFGALAFAKRLDSSRMLYHDRRFRGPEVVFKSSGVATKQEAIAAWLASTKGHRELLESGAITAIACYGRACVGRGRPVEKLEAVDRRIDTLRDRVRAQAFARRTFLRRFR